MAAENAGRRKVDRQLQVLDHRIGANQPGARFDQRRLQRSRALGKMLRCRRKPSGPRGRSWSPRITYTPAIGTMSEERVDTANGRLAFRRGGMAKMILRD